MKKLWSNTLILGLMIPCLTFLFTSAAAPASGYADDDRVSTIPGGFVVTEDNPVAFIMPKAGCDANVDITNYGPGWIAIYVLEKMAIEPIVYYIAPGTSSIIGVEKGGGMAIFLDSGSHASGTYTL